jgi:hypothetical protein
MPHSGNAGFEGGVIPSAGFCVVDLTPKTEERGVEEDCGLAALASETSSSSFSGGCDFERNVLNIFGGGM